LVGHIEIEILDLDFLITFSNIKLIIISEERGPVQLEQRRMKNVFRIRNGNMKNNY